MAIIVRRARGKGDKGKCQNIAIRLSEQERDALLDYCYEHRKSISAVVVPWIMQGINRTDLILNDGAGIIAKNKSDDDN